ncbi:hypothetical protein BJX66DRAFT_134762 [Aspergillus keveii]|uniref:C2H2-type domain-containing protein n=1 Tax=Aspergillus keveii TaxID=714993 RepID=A0ABR4FJ35_9EURO
MSRMRSHTCQICNKAFSKSEHLTRHERGHTNERPYGCLVCGKFYSRSDVLRRHERGHRNASLQSQEQSVGDTKVLPPSSEEMPHHSAAMVNYFYMPDISLDSMNGSQLSDHQPALGMNPQDPLFHASPSCWSPGAPLEVDMLDFTLTPTVSEWAHLPSLPLSKIAEISSLGIPTSIATRAPTETDILPANTVTETCSTRLPAHQETKSARTAFRACSGSGLDNIAAGENYPACLSQRLQPRMNEETLPSAQQLTLYANLFFRRFHSLLPVVHVPSFKTTPENSLLFISICSVGSLFVGSPYAFAQGTRLFERLNKVIQSSWESTLARSRTDALAMVLAAIIGQTFAILSGRPKDLILADVLHGTVMAWARESDKSALPFPCDPNEMDLSEGMDIDEQWRRWIDHEQRRRVDIALNIQDAELASLLHHEPIRKHRLTQYPRLASDVLFMAATASEWAGIYKNTMTPLTRMTILTLDDPLQAAGADSKFAAYGVLESINALVLEARRSQSFDEHESTRLSNLLMRWWRKYSVYLLPEENGGDCVTLPVLWHSIYLVIYADMELLERVSRRDAQAAAGTNGSLVRSWSRSLDASKCVVHAFLVRCYVERMTVSTEPAIHLPRALFGAAISWFCFTHIGGQQGIDARAFDTPEIQSIRRHTVVPVQLEKGIRDSVFADLSHVHHFIDLLNRVGRWGISASFASVLCSVVEGTRSYEPSTVSRRQRVPSHCVA